MSALEYQPWNCHFKIRNFNTVKNVPWSENLSKDIPPQQKVCTCLSAKVWLLFNVLIKPKNKRRHLQPYHSHCVEDVAIAVDHDANRHEETRKEEEEDEGGIVWVFGCPIQ